MYQPLLMFKNHACLCTHLLLGSKDGALLAWWLLSVFFAKALSAGSRLIRLTVSHGMLLCGDGLELTNETDRGPSSSFDEQSLLDSTKNAFLACFGIRLGDGELARLVGIISVTCASGVRMSKREFQDRRAGFEDFFFAQRVGMTQMEGAKWENRPGQESRLRISRQFSMWKEGAWTC